ncbi:hypothetical protein [Peptoniphilus indolicus]|uniref:Uncharacterized protein n=2 Tax=Peptoniphilus TaxID=162289 RepID=A0A379D9C1_9FIRM|nr:hypothetical protein [Peptoniphilus indolicus]SUB74596.1 Uncharacterised protein [Peptoniphilus indolicus]
MKIRRKISVVYFLFFIFCIYVLVRYHGLEVWPKWQQLTRERVIYLMNTDVQWSKEPITHIGYLVGMAMCLFHLTIELLEKNYTKKVKNYIKSKKYLINLAIWIVAISLIFVISKLTFYKVYMDLIIPLAYSLGGFIFINSKEANE